MRMLNAAKMLGPAFLVSVAYIDPGNWAAAIEAGSRFGYQLVWVVVVSNIFAILLQTLAARLGLVTGKHLAQVCREAYPPLVCWLLWLLCEVSIVALDLTMVLGTAIGLNMLFGWPLLPCILLTSLDVLLLMALVPRQGVKTSEQLTVGLLAVVVVCFMVDLVVSRPPLTSVLGGLVPRLEQQSVYAAVCLLGANCMPHSFYLHSALVCGQARGKAGHSLSQLCLYNFVDVAAALGVALVINVALLVVAAATFHPAGIVVETLQAAHDLMEQTLSSTIAPAAFGMALICAGQLSTFTGTIAGQVVLRGFLNVRIGTWQRRLATRTAAVLPAAVLQYLYGDKGTYKFLLTAQVVLALQLPFTLVPLIKATSSRALMGAFRNSLWVEGAAWTAGAGVFLANLALFISQLMPGTNSIPEVLPDAKDSAVHQYMDNFAVLAWQNPTQFLMLLGFLLAASALLALQLWMIVTPLHCAPLAAPPLLLRQTEAACKADDAAVWESMPSSSAGVAVEMDVSRARRAALAGDGAPPPSWVLSPLLQRWLFGRRDPVPGGMVPLGCFSTASEESRMLVHWDGAAAGQLHGEGHERGQGAADADDTAGWGQPALLAPPSLDAAGQLPPLSSVLHAGLAAPLDGKGAWVRVPSVEAPSECASDASGAASLSPLLPGARTWSWPDSDGGSLASGSAARPERVSSSGGDPPGAVTPRGASLHGPMPRGARKQLAAILDDFWGRLYDKHGAFVQAPRRDASAEPAAPSGGLAFAFGGFWSTAAPAAAPGAAQPGAWRLTSPLQCTHTGGRLCCPWCGDLLLREVRGCLVQLHQLQGASDVLFPAGGSSSMHSHCGWAAGVLQQPAAVRHLHLVTSLAAGEVQQALGVASAVDPSAAAVLGAGDESPQPLAMGAAVGPQQLGPAALLSFGLWGLLTLLQWCQVESRPELWGKYTLVLNKLQGLMTVTALAPAPAATGTHLEAATEPFTFWPWPPSEREHLRTLLLLQLQELEQFLQGRRGPSGSTAATAAYGKGKEIGLSLVKRLRRKLLSGQGTAAAPRARSSGVAAAVSLRGGAAGVQVLLASLLLLSCASVAALCSSLGVRWQLV